MGKNCRQYQEELELSKETDQDSKRTAAMLEEMVDRGEALSCPTCAVVLMKKWGCDWLRCSMCKTEICWVTKGPRWGPGVSETNRIITINLVFKTVLPVSHTMSQYVEKTNSSNYPGECFGLKFNPSESKLFQTIQN